MTEKTEFDPVERPRHYVESAVKIEPIELLRNAPFDLGCALKYLIRYDKKGNAEQDLRKALWYIECTEESLACNRYVYDEFIRMHFHLLCAFLPFVRNNGTSQRVREVLDVLREYAEKELEFRSKQNGTEDQEA